MSLGTGSSSSAIVTGGRNPGYNGLTEIWSAPSTFQTITQGQLFYNSTANAFKETLLDFAGATWSSGGDLNEATYANAGAGTQTAGAEFGGNEGPGQSNTTHEKYDGTSWTTSTAMSNGRREHIGIGVTDAAYIAVGGENPSGNYDGVEAWNGSSWAVDFSEWLALYFFNGVAADGTSLQRFFGYA